MSAGPSLIPKALSSAKSGVRWQIRSRPLVVVTAVAVVVTLNAIGLIVVIRRFAGALREDLPRDAMLVAALVTATVVACTRIAWRNCFPLESAKAADKAIAKFRGDKFIGYGSSLALLLLAVGCCYPANYTSDWLIWLPLLVADQFWRQSFFDAGQPSDNLDLALSEEANAKADAHLAFSTDQVSVTPLTSEARSRGLDEQEEDLEEIVQQLFRVRDEQGREVVYGTLRADFQAGQRTAVVHVGFCPPLSHLPEIEAEAIPGSAARLRIVQAFAHGTRLEVRLAAPAEADCHVWIDMAATPTATPRQIQT